MPKILADAEKALEAILDFQDEDTPAAQAQKRVINYLRGINATKPR